MSPSKSPSLSASLSPSLSASLSPSLSKSLSPSLSASLSPSEGYELYTRGNYANLPTNDNNLENNYTAQDYLDVDEKDAAWVEQASVDEYVIHQFKDFVGANTKCTVELQGKTNLEPAWSIVKLEIFNHTSGDWDFLDSDNTTAKDTDFILTKDVADLTNYKDDSNVISCRVWQLGL